MCPPGGPGQTPDPIDFATGIGSYDALDIKLPSAVSEISFERYFASSPSGWQFGDSLGRRGSAFLPTPFGTIPVDGGTGIQWSHSFYSFVSDRPLGWTVRYPSGRVSTFEKCMSWDGGGCFSKVSPDSSDDLNKLYWNPVDGGSIVVFKSTDNSRLVYASRWDPIISDGGVDGGVTRFFLTRLEASTYAGNRTAATLKYATPALAGGCPGSSANGVPYLESVTTAEGAMFGFSYARLPARAGAKVTHECVMSTMSIDGGPRIANYAYVSNTAGLLQSVTYPERPTLSASGRTETYSYTGGFSVVEDSQTLMSLVGDGGILVQQRSAVDGTLRAEWSRGGSSSVGCVTDGGCLVATSIAIVQEGTLSGEGTNTAAASTFSPVVEQQSYFSGARQSRSVRSAGSTSDEWQWRQLSSGQVATKSIRNESGKYTVYSAAPSSANFAAATFTTPTEVSAIYRGATDSSGTAALSVTNYSYRYGDGGSPRSYEQQVSTETMTTVVDGGISTTVRYYNYDSTNRLVSVIKSGNTKQYAGRLNWPTASKYIGTFYRTTSSCSGGSADSLGRVVEVHGPCEVSSANATDCDVSGFIPVVGYEYYPNSGGNDRNRLYKVKRYPSVISVSSCGTPLVKTYSSYDVFGNPATVVDEAGVSSSYSYKESRVTSANGYSFGYDGDKLTWSLRPNGLYDVYCYRAGAPGSTCNPYASPTSKIRERILARTSDGSNMLEGISYLYGSDGLLKSESFYDASGATRRTVNHESDVNGNETYTQFGSSAPTVRVFDALGAQTGIGLPFQGAQALCGAAASPGTPSNPLCAALTYDALGRLSSMSEDMDGGTSASTCFTYDAQGNISSVSQGGVGCVGPVAKYGFDDFGNVNSTTLPNALGVTAGGVDTSNPYPTLSQFNSMGLPVVTQTGGMIHSGVSSYNYSLRWTYDSMGRKLQSQSFDGSSTTVLSTNVWDTPSSLPGSCSSFLSLLTNTGGRLASSSDPVWLVFYGYDGNGRIVTELKVRRSTLSCSSPLKDQYALTKYQYTNGDLTSITYPHGRTVTFGYGTGGNPGRVSSVMVSQNTNPTGTSWSSVQTITNVVWEPFSGLRKYRVYNPFTISQYADIEYLPGSTAELTTPVSNCSTAPMPSGNDYSGRVRAITVLSHAGGAYLYKKFYSYSADQVVQTDTCLLPGVGSITAPLTEQFTYDTRGRLTSAVMPYFGTSGGPYSSMRYVYDVRGNRTAVSDGGLGWRGTSSYATSFSSDVATPDFLLNQRATAGFTFTGTDAGIIGSTSIYTDFAYDLDGHLKRRLGPLDSSGYNGTQLTLDWGESMGTASFGQQSVFRAAGVGLSDVSPVYYNYYYDASRRRISKEYPLGESDEFFWDSEKLLLEDRGLKSTVTSTTTYAPLDEYVWLGGRPVMQIHSGIVKSTNPAIGDTRVQDGVGTCERNGEMLPCDSYYLITDLVGRPVLMLDRSMNISGTGEYSPFGSRNRVPILAETPHGLTVSTADPVWVSSVGQPRVGGMNLQLRAHFPMVDSNSAADGCSSAGVSSAKRTVDKVYFSNPGGSPAPIDGNRYGGRHLGELWTNWMTQDGGSPNLHIVAASVPTPVTNNCFGFALDAIEYRRYSTAQPFFTNLVAPGMYFDRETDLFENWNRYYDPSTGRYLSPEPKLQEPNWVKHQAMEGFSAPTYAYARNNPVKYTDPDGKAACIDSYSCCIQRNPYDPEMCGSPEDQRIYCRGLKQSALTYCSDTVLPCKDPADQSMKFFKCVNAWMLERGCPPGVF